MTPSTGLRTHIWNNNLKSLALLAGFPVLLVLLAFAGSVLFNAVALEAGTIADALSRSARAMPAILPFALAGAGLWFVIAWFGHQAMIDAMTGARAVSRTEEPELYNLLENLCISRGLAMPHLRIIETRARNAYASGLREGQYSVTVTRGLLESLERDEICLLYTSPSPRDQRGSRMPSSA